MLTPILVDHTGRDGSTLLMRLLATSPNVAIPGPYPYEKKYFAYLWRWSRLLERRDKSDWWTSIDLSSLTYESVHPLMGPLPWSSDLIHDREDPMSKHMFDAAWREFSRRAAERVRAERGDPGADVRYYGEKHQDTRLIDLIELPPVRVIVLVRDPRDIYVSFRAFDAKRRSDGGPAFLAAQTAPDESEEDRLVRFIDRERTRMHWIAEVEASGDSYRVLRYEDLVRDLPGQSRRLEEWLSISLDSDAAAGDAELRELHVSASSPEASVGRWRSELDPELAERFSREFRDELTALGYTVEARG